MLKRISPCGKRLGLVVRKFEVLYYVIMAYYCSRGLRVRGEWLVGLLVGVTGDW